VGNVVEAMDEVNFSYSSYSEKHNFLFEMEFLIWASNQFFHLLYQQRNTLN